MRALGRSATCYVCFAHDAYALVHKLLAHWTSYATRERYLSRVYRELGTALRSHQAPHWLVIVLQDGSPTI